MADCSCHRLSIGDARDWQPHCPAHGEGSDWYLNGGKAYFEARREYTRELQRLAQEARRTGLSQSHKLPKPPNPAEYIKEAS